MKKQTTAVKKPAVKKPAAKKPAAKKQPAVKKPAAKKPAGKKQPAAQKPAAKKPAATGGNLAKALADLRTLALEMRERSSFRVQFEDHHVMPAGEIDNWQEIVREVSADASYTIPAELREVYALTGGFDFHWSCVADEGVFTGSIVLASLPELFQRDDEQKTPMKKCMAMWRRVDTVSDDSYAALRVDGGAAGVGCTFFKNGKPTKATWSLPDYILAAADHIGALGWQTGDTRKAEKIVRTYAAY